MLAIPADSSPGVHAPPHAACSAASERFFGAPVAWPNRRDNLRDEMARRGIDLGWTPGPWSLFEHAIARPDGSLIDGPAAAGVGDCVERRARTDLPIVCSARPSSVGDGSRGTPRGAAIERGSVSLARRTTG